MESGQNTHTKTSICFIHRGENAKSDFLGSLVSDKEFLFDYRGASAAGMMVSAFFASWDAPRADVYFAEGGLCFWVAWFKKLFFPRTKIVVMAIDPLFNRLGRSRFENRFLARAFGFIDYALPISQLVADDFRFYTKTVPYSIADHYIDIENFSGIVPDYAQKNILFMIRRPDETGKTKGLDIALRIFESVCARDSAWHLYLIGSGTENLALQNPRIHCEGNQKPEDYLKKCPILLVPGRYEASSLAAAEACASGVVPLVSATSGMSEFVKKVNPEWTISCDRPELFAEQILKWSALPIEQKRAWSEKLRTLGETFSKKASVSQLEHAVSDMNKILGTDISVKRERIV